MTNIVPGAIWTPVDVGKRDARRKGRGLIGHVAVSDQTNLKPWLPPSARPSDWHFYLPKEAQPEGRFFQQIDLDVQSWSSRDANEDTAAFESQGGVGDDVQGPWTENQLESGAIILAYMNETEDVPLQDMVNSLASSRGFGIHRYGIDPWRVNGGQVWSSSYGKECPGDHRVTQVPILVSRAIELRHGSPSPSPAPHPQPRPAPTPPRLSWRLPRGHYIGDIAGPMNCHGGDPRYDSPAIIELVKNCQEWLIFHGCVAGVRDWHSGWADGRFEAPYSTNAAIAWHRRFYPGQPYPDQIWSDDYDRLARA